MATEEALGKGGLQLTKPATGNMFCDLDALPYSIYKRTGEAVFPNTKKRLSDQYRTVAKKDETVLESDLFAKLHEQSKNGKERRRFTSLRPCPQK